MRSIIFSLTATALLMASPAFAGPAYKASDVVKYFVDAKAKAGLGNPRQICVEGDPDCKVKGAATPFDLRVSFDFDSDRLTPAAQEQLDQFAQALRDPQLKGLKFALDGFTDATGAEVYNLGLSERRAYAVAHFLSAHGIARGALVAKGYGPANPRAPDPFDPANRRVETHLVE